MVVSLEKGKGSRLKKPAFVKKELRQFHVLPPFPCRAKKDIALLEERVKDQFIRFQKWIISLPLKIKECEVLPLS